MKEQNRPLTLAVACEKARKFCAYQERCHSELRTRLYEWKLPTPEVETVIATMIEENFLNEERFARAFAGGRFRQKQWGRLKIVQELKQKQVSPWCIQAGLSEIEDAQYLETMQREMEKKRKTLRDRNPLVRNQKIARFMMGKGYEPQLVWDALRQTADE